MKNWRVGEVLKPWWPSGNYLQRLATEYLQTSKKNSRDIHLWLQTDQTHTRFSLQMSASAEPPPQPQQKFFQCNKEQKLKRFFIFQAWQIPTTTKPHQGNTWMTGWEKMYLTPQHPSNPFRHWEHRRQRVQWRKSRTGYSSTVRENETSSKGAKNGSSNQGKGVKTGDLLCCISGYVKARS